MSNKRLSREAAQQAVDAVAACGGNIAQAADKLGIPRTTLQSRIAFARRFDLVPEAKPEAPVAPVTIDLPEAIMLAVKRSPASLEELAAKVGCTKGQALDAIDTLKTQGRTIALLGEKYTVSAAPEPAFMRVSSLPTYTSRPDGTYVFGACGDNHLGSKYARLDVLEELYDRYAAEGVDRVYNTGNWIDGEARFNKHDLIKHGMDNQLRYLAEVYPKREGLTTYAVAGDDHEGWYAQGAGVDIGQRAEHTMRQHGRTDWVNLGYMEAHIRLVHAQTGAESILAVVHPGGGSAYAVSYSIQKIIESLDGGEKPAVGLYGHYHKLWFGNIRNVWCVQTGTTEDQTPFMRKKKLEAHVGGTLVKLRQDPQSGAIVSCAVELIRFFNRGFYNGRWNHGGDVVHAERAP